MTMIQLRAVTKHYQQGTDRVCALDRVELTVEKGEFLSIMGPSGSGKSTLLQLIGGLDTPTAGEIEVGGRAVARMDDDELTLYRRRCIGFVFQFFNLLPTLSAEENVALPMLLEGKRPADVRRRVEHLLELVGLTHRRRHRPDELSGGEMQRVAIARALVNDPVVLLADEPTGNLDSQTGEQIMDLILRTTEAHDTTIVLVTHDLRVAEHGDRIITLRDGRIVEDARQRSAGRRARPLP